MKFIIFSDLHSHQFTEFYTIGDDGINSRLAACLDIFDQVGEYATLNSVDNIIFCGDLFHTRPSVNTLTYNLTLAKIVNLAKKFNIYLLPGNHDCYSKDEKHHSLELLSNISNVTILNGETSSLALNKDVTLHSVGYNDSTDNIKSSIKSLIKEKKDDTHNILLLHTEIFGSQTPAGYTFDHGVKSAWLAKHFDHVFNGHVHKYYKFNDKVYNVGSPLHQDWGDKQDRKGFLVLDTVSNSVSRVRTKYPEFREIDELDISTSKGDKRNFYKINFEDSITERQLADIKAEIPFSILDYKIDNSFDKRSSLSLGMSIDELMDEYLDNAETKLNKKSLRKIGSEIVNE